MLHCQNPIGFSMICADLACFQLLTFGFIQRFAIVTIYFFHVFSCFKSEAVSLDSCDQRWRQDEALAQLYLRLSQWDRGGREMERVPFGKRLHEEHYRKSSCEHGKSSSFKQVFQCSMMFLLNIMIFKIHGSVFSR